MAGNYMSPPERIMRETIEWLVDLPEGERASLEEASCYTFTRERPAPEWQAPPPTAAAGGGGPLLATLNMGSLEATVVLCRLGFQPAVLNFAHGHNCGGGFEHAGGSQEENIFRSSSAFLSLWPHRREDDGPGVLARGMWIGDFDQKLARKTAFYPLTSCGGVYSPRVILSRHIEAAGRPLWSASELEASPRFGVVTAAAQDVPRDGGFVEDLLVQKCRTVLHIAAEQQHAALVLGAFGCGYFANPPDVVAKTFQDLLGKEFAAAFKVVIFAVPDKAGRNLNAFSGLFALTDAKDLKDMLEVTSMGLPTKSEGSSCSGGCSVT